MNLEKNYLLLDVVRDDDIRTLKAKEIASGRELEVHLFMKQEDHALFERLHGLPLSARKPLLELGSEMKIPFVVTDPLPAETTARAWFTTLAKSEQSSPEPKAPQPIKASVWKTGTPLPDPLFPPDPSEAKPDDFTRMFQVAVPLETKPAQPEPAESAGEFTRMFAVPAVPAPAAETPKPGPNQSGPNQSGPNEPGPSKPGEFTRMFQIPARPERPAVSEPPAVSEAVVSQPDDFTRMFQPPAPAPAALSGELPTEEIPGTAVQAPASPAVDPDATRLFAAPPVTEKAGEFTKLFQGMHSGAPSNPEPVQPSGPGEFTRMFSSPLGPGEPNRDFRSDPLPPPPPPPGNQPGEFTKLYGAPSGDTPPKSAAPPWGGGGRSDASATGAFESQAPPPYREPPQQGPGEFTRMMDRGAAPKRDKKAPPPVPAPATAEPAAVKSPSLALFVCLSAIAVIAIMMIAYFAMRH